MATYIPTGPGTRDEREDLADYVTRIDPARTPFFSNGGKKSATAIKHEWEIVELAAADATNFQGYGADSSDTDGIAPYRMYNVVGESTKDGKVADLYDGINTSGGQNALQKQKIWKGLELKRDLEAIVTSNNAYDAGVLPKSAGAQTYITNGSYGAGLGAPPAGDGSDTATDGDPRALDTIDYVDTGMLQAYTDGGKPQMIYMDPSLRQKFSKIPDAIAGGAASLNQVNQTNSAPMTFVGSTGVYLSDYGQLEVIPSIHMATGVILGIDPEHCATAAVPGMNFKADDLAKVGTSERFVVTYDGCLEMDAPKASFQVRDLT